jgi:hypothetical protein
MAPGYEADPLSGVLSPTDLASIGQYFGNIAEQEARDAQAGLGQSIGPSAPGWGEQLAGERSAGAPGVDTSAPSPGEFGNYGEGQGGGGQQGGGDDSGGRDAGSAGDAGTGTGGESGSGYTAKGGVFKAGKPTTRTFGEAGKETGIFVPEWMKRPGIQGKEKTIIAALETLLRELRASTGAARKEK